MIREEEKILITFYGELNTEIVAELTDLFRQYRINIIDLNMYNIEDPTSTLDVTFLSSSTTDEIDSFWNEINIITNKRELSLSREYLSQ
jgi:predicted amino acid-binding ACT domain protein